MGYPHEEAEELLAHAERIAEARADITPLEDVG